MLETGRTHPLADIIDTVLADPTSGSGWCLYTGPGRAPGEYLVDEHPEVGDDDTETYPPAVRERGLDYFLSGQMCEDVILNLDHQGAPLDEELCARALRFYSERDTFLPVEPVPHLRTLSRIVGRVGEYPAITDAHVSPVVRLRVRKLLGRETADTLVALQGRELSPDIRIDLAGWTDTPYRLVAVSGTGDTWAVRTTDGHVVFRDGADAAVDLRIGVEDFLRVADLWGQCGDADTGEFLRAVAPLLPVPVEQWTWPCRL